MELNPEPQIIGDRGLSDEAFTDLVQVMSFSEHASEAMNGAPIPFHLSRFADGEAQARGYHSWSEAATLP